MKKENLAILPREVELEKGVTVSRDFGNEAFPDGWTKVSLGEELYSYIESKLRTLHFLEEGDSFSSLGYVKGSRLTVKPYPHIQTYQEMGSAALAPVIIELPFEPVLVSEVEER